MPLKDDTPLAKRLLQYYQQLEPPYPLPDGVEVLFPQQDKAVMKLVEQFLLKFYDDTRPRKLMLGINPGRFGAGVTGINFTAPLQLSQYCGIEHSLGSSSELSAAFIYEVIDAYGGPATFYADWFISSVCPLGFVQYGKNMNYYDDVQLQHAVTPFIVNSINRLMSFQLLNTYCICIGGDKNYRYLSALNEVHQWFRQISTVPHPRFIMQYKKKDKARFIDEYLTALSAG